MMYTMPKNLLSICVNFTLATQLSVPPYDSPAVLKGDAAHAESTV